MTTLTSRPHPMGPIVDCRRREMLSTCRRADAPGRGLRDVPIDWGSTLRRRTGGRCRFAGDRVLTMVPRGTDESLAPTDLADQLALAAAAGVK